MVLKEQEPVRSKIVIDNKIIVQVNFFNFLGNFIYIYIYIYISVSKCFSTLSKT